MLCACVVHSSARQWATIFVVDVVVAIANNWSLITAFSCFSFVRHVRQHCKWSDKIIKAIENQNRIRFPGSLSSHRNYFEKLFRFSVKCQRHARVPFESWIIYSSALCGANVDSYRWFKWILFAYVIDGVTDIDEYTPIGIHRNSYGWSIKFDVFFRFFPFRIPFFFSTRKIIRTKLSQNFN